MYHRSQYPGFFWCCQNPGRCECQLSAEVTGKSTFGRSGERMDQNHRNLMIPFYLVTGFLGSGKTTLVKRMLEEYGDQKQVGIIQNEFAPANLDGIDLQQTGRKFKILEINKGSVFCVCLLSNFIESLHEFIVQEKPDILILEASGLSDPVSIGELLDAPALRHTLFLAHIWCVVDALRFLQMEP